MIPSRRILGVVGLLCGLLFATGCSSTQQGKTASAARKPYESKAYHPQNPNNVRVKVSLANQMVYVMEGDRPLLVTPTFVGTTANPTPTGNFRIFIKTANRRSNSYGFSNDPEFPADVLMTDRIFNLYHGKIFED